MSAEPVVREIVFEALFVRAHQPTGGFREKLKSAGFDLGRPQPEYPCSVLGRSVEVAVAELLPGETRAHATRELGRRFTGGILSTPLGRAIGTALFVAGPIRVVKRVPALVKSDFGMELRVEQTPGAGCRVFAAPATPAWFAEFLAGVFEALLVRANVRPTVELKPAPDASSAFMLEVAWAAKAD